MIADSIVSYPSFTGHVELAFLTLGIMIFTELFFFLFEDHCIKKNKFDPSDESNSLPFDGIVFVSAGCLGGLLFRTTSN